MNLRNKKELASKVLGAGKNRIKFDSARLKEIKEAITKQDIKDLYKDGFIEVKPEKGRRKLKKRKLRRGPGKIKRKIYKRKKTYVKITRKLRAYLKELKKRGEISRQDYWDLRKKVKSKFFKNKLGLKEYLHASEKMSVVEKNAMKKTAKTEKSKNKTNLPLKEGYKNKK